MTYYKVLSANGESTIQRHVWPLPNGKPGRWVSVDGPLIACQNGLHVVEAPHLTTWLEPNCRIFEAEIGAELLPGDKIVARRARLVREMRWNDHVARLFAADCAAYALTIAAITDERAWTAVDVAIAFALGHATHVELTAARTAAWSAAWTAARTAAGDAAWTAAGDAAWALIGERLVHYLENDYE